jgi:hypothetical protein
MLNRDVLSIPDCLISERSYTLSRPIAGIQLVPAEGKQGRLGNVSQLCPGSLLDFCGEGYDTRTVKVRCKGNFYFVFLQDLDGSFERNARS